MTIITTSELTKLQRESLIRSGSRAILTDSDLDNLLNICDDLAAVFIDYTPKIISTNTIQYFEGFITVLEVEPEPIINHVQQISNELCIIFAEISVIDSFESFDVIQTHRTIYENIIRGYANNLELQDKTTIKEVRTDTTKGTFG